MNYKTITTESLQNNTIRNQLRQKNYKLDAPQVSAYINNNYRTNTNYIK